MFIRKLTQVAISSLFLVTSAQAATTFYSNEAAFLSASGGSLTFESFENASMASATSVSFPGGSFDCSGSSYCPGFYGISSLFAHTGVQSVYFASPDSATFTFSSAINAFGIHIGGAGDVAVNTMTAMLGNGDSGLALNNYSGPYTVFGTNDVFFGAISSTPFTTVTFIPNNRDDGIFFDSMHYGTAPVPEPESYAMMLAGLGLVGLLARRRQNKLANLA